MVNGFNTSSPRHLTEFCAKPDGSVQSVHGPWTTGEIERKFDFEYAVLTCVCGQTLQGSRLTKEDSK
jgi:hypothetical protein